MVTNSGVTGFIYITRSPLPNYLPVLVNDSEEREHTEQKLFRNQIGVLYIISQLGDIWAIVVHTLGVVAGYPHTGARE